MFLKFYSHRSIRVTLALCLIGFWGFQPGCGSWSGNPPATNDPDTKPGTLSLTIIGSGAQTQLMAGMVPIIGRQGTQVGTLELSEARLVFDQLKIKQDQNDAEERDTVDSTHVVDLLQDSIRPELPTLELSPGGYKNIEMRLHRLQAGEVSGVASSDSLIQHAIVIKGTFHPTGGTPIALTLKMDAEEEFSLMKPGSTLPGMQVQSEAELKAIIAFRMDRWFDFSQKDNDLSDLSGTEVTLEKDGSELGKKLLEIVQENIKSSADFGEDKDGDGELGKDEDENESNDSED